MAEKSLAAEKNRHVAALIMDEVLAELHSYNGSCLDMDDVAREIIYETVYEILKNHYK